MRRILLTETEYQWLVEIVDSVQDEGPSGNGWASPELEELRQTVKNAEKVD